MIFFKLFYLWHSLLLRLYSNNGRWINMNMEQWWNDSHGAKPGSTRTELCPCATLFTTNTIETALTSRHNCGLKKFSPLLLLDLHIILQIQLWWWRQFQPASSVLEECPEARWKRSFGAEHCRQLEGCCWLHTGLSNRTSIEAHSTPFYSTSFRKENLKTFPHKNTVQMKGILQAYARTMQKHLNGLW